MTKEDIGFVKEQRLREEVSELKTEEIVYTQKVLNNQELKDEKIKLSL